MTTTRTSLVSAESSPFVCSPAAERRYDLGSLRWWAKWMIDAASWAGIICAFVHWPLQTALVAALLVAFIGFERSAR